MDPAEPAEPDLFKVLSVQGQTIGRHEQGLKEIGEAITTLSTLVTQLGSKLSEVCAQLAPSPTTASASRSTPAQASVSSAPTSAPREPFMPIPQPFSGDMGACEGFLLKCDLVFEQQPQTYATDRSRIAYIVGLLSGKASEWATAAWTSKSPICHSYSEFTTEMKRIFDHPIQSKEAGQRLISLRQGSTSVAQYALNFRIAAAESGWDQRALQGAFFHGLNDNIKDELAARDECTDLEALIALTIRLDNRLRERRREKMSRGNSAPMNFSIPQVIHSKPSSETVFPPVTQDEPMQLGRLRLDPAERQRRIQSRLCFYCGSSEHFRDQCYLRPKAQAHQ